MKTLESQPEGLFQNPSLKADTYLDETTNLLYCKKCRTPRQKRFEVCGRIFTPLCLCACLAQAEEAREAEVKHREFLDRVAKNRSLGLPEPELRKHTFQNDLGFTRSRWPWPVGMWSIGRKMSSWERGCCCGAMWAPGKATWPGVLPTHCWIVGWRCS